jgi:hypothetical protein
MEFVICGGSAEDGVLANVKSRLCLIRAARSKECDMRCLIFNLCIILQLLKFILSFQMLRC